LKESWDPEKICYPEKMFKQRAVRAKDTAYVTMDLSVFPPSGSEKDYHLAWEVISSHYNYQLFDFMKFMKGVCLQNAYYFPATSYAAETLIKYFHAKPTLEALKLIPHICPEDFAKKLGAHISPSIFKQAESEKGFKGLSRPLFPFQREGILLMTYKGGKVLLADEMGLGKTIQALGFWLYNHIGRTLIVCPNSVKLNWRKEILDWLHTVRSTDIMIINASTTSERIPNDKTFYIINYDIVEKYLNILESIAFELFIIDEAHYIKTSNRKRTKAVLQVAAKIEYILALTGTPVINRAVEIWNLLHLLLPTVFKKKTGFVSAFTYDKQKLLDTSDDADAVEHAITSSKDYHFTRFKNPELLGGLLRETIMIRRTKEEVLPELPEKRRTMVPIECGCEEHELYKQAEGEFKTELSKSRLSIHDFLMGRRPRNENDQCKAFAALEKARQMAAMAKLNSAIEWLKDCLEETDKLVVFAHHQDIIKKVLAEFRDISVSITGSTSIDDREAAIERFKTAKQIKMIVISITAGGEGINLTASSTVVFLESGWSPATNQQAEDRVHRIGQYASAVNIYHLVGEKTIDIPIYKLVYEKEDMISQMYKKMNEESKETIGSIISSLNHHLNPLGLHVDYDQNLMHEILPIHQEEWLTLNDAVEFAQTQGSKIIKTNLLDDIRLGRIASWGRKWVDQVGGRKGYWLITRQSLVRRIEERRRGPGRPKKSAQREELDK
jgi:SWI/SNF-related matrix-associated actin-dependent regulator 1 of chromatin subfamily A